MSDETERNPVGYCKPPVQTRFKKGQSGNPKGRPKGTKNLTKYVNETFYQPKKMRVNGQIQKIVPIEAMLMKLSEKGLQGDLKAMQMILKCISLYEVEAQKLRNARYDGGVLVIPAPLVPGDWEKVYGGTDQAILPPHRFDPDE